MLKNELPSVYIKGSEVLRFVSFELQVVGKFLAKASSCCMICYLFFPYLIGYKIWVDNTKGIDKHTGFYRKILKHSHTMN